ncbi:ribose-phosphate pyrophosphokinase [Gibbsiella quercinecans]|uniref:ribose-phosphate diphosphokinase n=1 Tax=Gibbsiella quercinecans TaxID=929813 RepID=UPI000EF1D864|nr:ribose-phosphate diphosphokinase [Gibbsiella quercinecans]RLM07798.1 ribose-phosphate pyrophosphokinase [Gibbsiella quercinecans]
MSAQLQLFLDSVPMEVITGRFPDGAVYARFHQPAITTATQMRIRATAMRSMDDFMLLAQLVDAVRHRFLIKESLLELPYLPYARQDRHMGDGDSFALQVFGQLLNTLAFDRVTVLDPHSDVAAAAVNRLHAITQQQCMQHSARLAGLLAQQRLMLIAPDAGALKKIHAVAAHFSLAEYGTMTKHRDVLTGELTGFELLTGDVQGKDVLIVDDLCDAGGTFIGAAQVLRQAGARAVSLYVTHGVFSQGTARLLAQGIDHIYTTTSYAAADIAGERVELIDIERIYAH